MLIFIISCVTLRSSIGYEEVEEKPRVHISEHLRASHSFGPTLQLEFAPNHQKTLHQFAIGAELAPLSAIAFGPSEYETNPLLYPFILSSIGMTLFHYQYDPDGSKYGVLNPYLNIHSPPLCLDGSTIYDTGTCFTIHGTTQAQIYLNHPNEFRWNVGISMHQNLNILEGIR